MNLPQSYTTTAIWYKDFENWFEKVSGKKLNILDDIGKEYGHFTYTEFEIRKYKPEDFNESWMKFQNEVMNDPENDGFNSDVIEAYIEQNGLLPIGRYIILADW